LATVNKAAEALAEDDVPKKKGSLRAKKNIPNSKPMVKMTRGKVTIDREALKAQIKRVKLADKPEAVAAERPAKIQRVVPKDSAKATKAKAPKSQKGTKLAKPRGRPPGALNKKTLARNVTRAEEALVAQAAA
jgi:hypothetical protein